MSGSIHKYVLDQLAATKGQWRVVAEETGLSRRTISKIARQEIPNPGVKSVELLAAYFRTSAGDLTAAGHDSTSAAIER